ncbi:MAG: hypothetical protein LBI82_09785 [Dysgonamonadaceae bacterium]|nr:hypothetical protein [Dysgonamonadaceae bacterium]
MLKKILTISLLICLCMSCEQNITSTIPNAPVRFTINLDSSRDKELNAPLSFLEYPLPPFLDEERFGYAGVLVVNGYGDAINSINLFAYDLACPNEAQSNVKIKPDPDKTGFATCPKCGAVYYIATGGAPLSGSKYWLRRYNVTSVQGSERRFRVTN